MNKNIGAFSGVLNMSGRALQKSERVSVSHRQILKNIEQFLMSLKLGYTNLVTS